MVAALVFPIMLRSGFEDLFYAPIYLLCSCKKILIKCLNFRVKKKQSCNYRSESDLENFLLFSRIFCPRNFFKYIRKQTSYNIIEYILMLVFKHKNVKSHAYFISFFIVFIRILPTKLFQVVEFRL